MSIESNEERAARAARAIAAYQGSDSEVYLHDLICDLGHWIDRHADEDAGGNTDLELACERGITSYQEEWAAEQPDPRQPN